MSLGTPTRANLGPIIAMLLSLSGPAHAMFQSALSLQSQQYATETAPGSRLSLNMELVSEAGDSSKRSLPEREIHFYSFYESGRAGDYSLDVDRSVLRMDLTGQGYIWVGRTHPLAEAIQGDTPSSVNAIGANWVQNQSDALFPRVSGWVGTGARVGDAHRGFSLTGAFSPIFLPSFGPRLQLSETSPAEGSRFSRFPPQYLRVGQAELPMRYDLQVGDIRDIVLQPQFFASVGHESAFGRTDLMYWSAPNPSPSTDVTGFLSAADELKAMIEVKPRFDRQNFVGTRFEPRSLPGKAVISSAYEIDKRELTASAETQPVRFVKVGALHKWLLKKQDPSPVKNPVYADRLVWGEISTAALPQKIRPSLRIEQHLSAGNSGRLFMPKLVYLAARKVDVYAVGQIITGKDRSYFGNWRSLDSIALGANWQW